MSFDRFNRRKKAVLLRGDRSSKGNFDKRVIKLCEKVNSLGNYYTTSSCAGRVIVMKDEDKKGPNLFQFVSHDLIDVREFKKELDKILYHQPTRDFARGLIKNYSLPQNHSPTLITYNKHITKSVNLVNSKSKFTTRGVSGVGLNCLNLKFKQEPCILHVVCRNLEDAFSIIDKAQRVGWKRSGIISKGKNDFIVELISTEKLEFPLTEKGKILVDDNFLKIILKKSNENLKKGWEKIKNLEKGIK